MSDDLWEVAMMAGEDHDGWKQSMEDDNDDDDEVDQAKVFRHSLSEKVMLILYPLPASDGVWSPVGADAWYASALLSGLLLQGLPSSSSKDGSKEIQNPFASLSNQMTTNKKVESPIILELGSGAMGLSGLVAAYVLDEILLKLVARPSWKVLLTDNDRPVLDQLKKNVFDNQSWLGGQRETDENDGTDPTDGTSSTQPIHQQLQLEVAYLDWADPLGLSKMGFDSTQNHNNEEIALVIGSELVYTAETGEACLRLLLQLLNTYQNVQIWIVQVMDRYGWQEIVLPGLENRGRKNDDDDNPKLLVDCLPLSMEMPDLAETMIPMGGTLDRYAYGCYWIRNDMSL